MKSINLARFLETLFLHFADAPSLVDPPRHLLIPLAVTVSYFLPPQSVPSLLFLFFLRDKGITIEGQQD